MKLKSKNVKILLISLACVAVLGGLTAVLLLTSPETEEQPANTSATVAVTDKDGNIVTDANGNTVTEAVTTPDLSFSEYETADIVSITIKNLVDDEYKIVQAAGSTADAPLWTVEGMESAPIDQTGLASIAGYAAKLEAMVLVDGTGEEAKHLEKYGLDDPRGKVSVKYSDGKTVTFIFGDQVVTSDSAYYFKLDGSDSIYTFSSQKLKYFEYTRYSFLTTALSEEYDSEAAPVVQNMTITRQDLEKPIIIEALPEVEEGEDAMTYQTHKMTSPYNVLVDASNSSDTVYGLYGLTANSGVWYGTDETAKAEAYKKYGLDNPFCTVSMTVGAKTTTLTIGNSITTTETDENGVTVSTVSGFYGVYSGQPNAIYQFDTKTVLWTYILPSDLMAKLFLTPYIYALESFTVETAEHKLQFTVEGDLDEHKFYLDGKEVADEESVKTLYQYLISAKGDAIYSEAFNGERMAKITYVYEDTALGTDVVEFFDSGDRKAVIKVNGIETFKSTILYADQLIKNIDAYLSGGEIIDTY